MLGEAAARQLMERALACSPADQTEVLLTATDSALTRFANSAIHQNVSEANAEVRVRVILGRRTGVATTNNLSNESLGQVVERATEIARLQQESPEQPELPEPSVAAPAASFGAATAACSPEQRALAAKVVCDLALEHGLEASGALSTDAEEVAVLNSRGLFAYEQHAGARIKTVVMGEDDAAGYAERTVLDLGDIDFEALAMEAVGKARDSLGAIVLEPGEYPVVLEEYAVGEALAYLSYMGFGALAVQEGHSFLTGRFGQQLMSPSISIWDDGLDPAGLPRGFDYEGVPKQRVSIVEQGVAREVVYDTASARREEGRSSTGHALPSPNPFGPFAWNLFMAPGDTDRADLAGGIARGIWVTRFHYVNVLQPRLSVLTGMTRDGTFLVENGQRTRPIKNFRFTQNMLEALSSVRAVGRTRVAVQGFMGVSVVPALALDRFTFTGVSALSA